MVFSYYLKNIPYCVIWQLLALIRKPRQIVLYCADVKDWFVFNFLVKKYENTIVVAKNSKTKKELKQLGVISKTCWVFPGLVVMARHAFHKFPCRKIKLVGMRHGPYHFKRMIGVQKYNFFDLYIFTSRYELDQAIKLGINSGAAGGYPKLDPAFDGTITRSDIMRLRGALGFDRKPVIIFTATWEKSGLSSVSKWYKRVGELIGKYNVLVTLHPWVKKSVWVRIESTPRVVLIRDPNILPYLMLADIMIGDTSSILAEFCALKKPMITFKVEVKDRLDKELANIIASISVQVDEFDQLIPSIEYLLKHRDELTPAQEWANNKMFLPLDGKHKEHCLTLIDGLISSIE